MKNFNVVFLCIFVLLVIIYGQDSIQIYVTDWYNHRIVKIDDMYGSNWASFGSSAYFDGTKAVAVRPDGKIYIADRGGNRICRIDDITGAGWITLGGFSRPNDIALGPDGKIYIADAFHDRIVRIDDISGSGWVTYGSSGSGINQFHLPCGIDFDDAGKIYIADQNNDRIVRIDDMTGTGWITFGTSGSGPCQFHSPCCIKVISNYGIYIADYLNSRIVKIDNMTGTGWESLGGFVEPHGVAVGPDKRIYIADTRNHRIIRVDDMTGTGWLVYGSSGSGVGGFNQPSYLTVISGYTNITENPVVKPEGFKLFISPNPFNTSCEIIAPECSKIEIYDLRGNVVGANSVRPTDKGRMPYAPTHRTFIWEPDESISSGIYIVKAKTDDGNCVTKHIFYLK